MNYHGSEQNRELTSTRTMDTFRVQKPVPFEKISTTRGRSRVVVVGYEVRKATTVDVERGYVSLQPSVVEVEVPEADTDAEALELIFSRFREEVPEELEDADKVHIRDVKLAVRPCDEEAGDEKQPA